MTEIKILAADIGATNSRFAVFRAPADPASLEENVPFLRLECELWLKGADFPDFTDALKELKSRGDRGDPCLIDLENPPDIAVIAPAGPIEGESCRISNLAWHVRAGDIRETLGISKVCLINDFAAQAYACLTPQSIDAVPVLQGKAVPGAPVAVVGAGTGFGKALLLCEGLADASENETVIDRMRRFRRARVLPTEGGHAEVPFVGAREAAFAEFAAKRVKTPRLIGDAVVTGSGLCHIFAFLTGRELSPHEAAVQANEEPEVVEWFARLYARLCRNFVLDTLSLGGLYITGGMALRVPALTHPAFAEEFHESAAQRRLLENVPVWHVRKPQAGLWGAALFGLFQIE